MKVVIDATNCDATDKKYIETFNTDVILSVTS